VRPFGEYQPPGQRNVRLENNGVHIQTTSGAEARAVFNGVVSAIFVLPGQSISNVMIRHGSYITIYANLSEVYVTNGERVSTSQRLGKIYTDTRDNATILQFEIRREREPLNPELWLR
jgi:septal ring factor EnvC (AmiA/AmiB activator)